LDTLLRAAAIEIADPLALKAMDLVLTISLGMCVGVMVELLLPGHTLQELMLAILLGVAGALVARFIGQSAGWFGNGDALGFLVAVIGAVLTLLLYGAFFRRHHIPR
jgi:uncharacterized membrane protein YeaQ/YmgE (transglycosylase-associated protein family)